jgi:hypothetical protein
MVRNMTFMIQAYRGDRQYQHKLWQPVKEAIKRWEKDYKALHMNPFSPPILTYRDGRHFLIIRHRRPGQDPMTHRLVGPSRSIYLFCCKHRSAKRILTHFPKIGEDKLLPFLKMLVDKKVMFEERGRYLSLAIPASRIH